MNVIHCKGQPHSNIDALSKLVRPSWTICKQYEMPWDYAYQCPCETENSIFSKSFVSENCQEGEKSKPELSSNEAICTVEDDFKHLDGDQEVPDVLIRHLKKNKQANTCTTEANSSGIAYK